MNKKRDISMRGQKSNKTMKLSAKKLINNLSPKQQVFTQTINKNIKILKINLTMINNNLKKLLKI